MADFLTDDRLEGPHAVRISARPERIAAPIAFADTDAFLAFVERECQLWGGAANIVIPLEPEGGPPAMYRIALPGSQVDVVYGMTHGAELSLPATLDVTERRDISRSQLAAGLLEYGKPSNVPPLEIVDLSHDDPWRGIYHACLGMLPRDIDPDIVRHGNWLPEIKFSDFVHVQRVEANGSLADLTQRLRPSEPVMTPRELSMITLSYRQTASSSLRSDRPVLPRSNFTRFDAGPNVLVVCSPGSTADLGLLWNLRAAHGDFYVTPIGLPSDQLSPATLRQVVYGAGLARHGSPSSSLYITSVSVGLEDLQAAAADVAGATACPPADVFRIGDVLGWTRDEVLVWTNGRAAYKPIGSHRHHDLLATRNFNRMTIMHFDVNVEDAPLPSSDDYRIDAFRNGSHTHWASPGYSEKLTPLEWPSRQLMARSVASMRDHELRESAPGIAARVLTGMMGGLWETTLLCHAPLLTLLESMASRQGFNWYKQRMRDAGVEVTPSDSVGSTIDELPEKSFHDFKKALGNDQRATKYWLEWAERASIILKGFPLQCVLCGAKQWIPVGSFAPPITCRGCGEGIDFPFGDRPSIDFKYRLSEPARRVYEADAMGHVLAARFFESVLGIGASGRLVGTHPGMSVLPATGGPEIGEADVLLFTRGGEFIPVEVKRSAPGLTASEVAKLDTLAHALNSSWSAVVACQYIDDTDGGLSNLAERYQDGTHRRIALSYDALLEPRTFWGLGADPFLVPPLTREQIGDREKKFVDYLKQRADDSTSGWLAYSMLKRRDGDE